jgi:hypothetical protein
MPFPITLEEFEIAYRETGLTPADQFYLNLDRKVACPLGARALHLNPAIKSGFRQINGLSLSQFASFVAGFDGERSWDSGDWDAYVAGRAARAHFLERSS